MNEKRTLKVIEHGIRLDSYLAKELSSELSRSAVKKLIKQGCVSVNDTVTTPHYIIKENDTIEILLPPKKEIKIVAENIPLDIVYEDEYLIAINKPSGLIVHPGAGNASNTLVNALMRHTKGGIQDVGDSNRPGIVHRLDKDTSGIIIVAKSENVLRLLAEEFKKRNVYKLYATVVKGVVQHDQSRCDLPLGRGVIFRKKMIVKPSGGKEALSEFFVQERFSHATYLHVRIHTGRTHQIRVHLAALGHPVLGDTLYGQPCNYISRQCLHAYEISFKHPVTDEQMVFTAAIPDDIKRLLTILREKE